MMTPLSGVFCIAEENTVEAATVPAETVAAEATIREVEAVAEKSPQKIFRWSEWLHIGEGAEECDERFTGECDDDEHYHIFVRLPNQYQIRDIAEKARAAKARKVRDLKTPDSDSNVILEEGLGTFTEADRDDLIEELLAKDFTDQFDATNETKELPEFETYDQDEEEYYRQAVLSEDERSDEFAQLESIVQDFAEKRSEKLKQIQASKRAGYEQQDLDALVGLVRRNRIDVEGTDAFVQTHRQWSWYIGSMRGRGVHDDGKPRLPKERFFSSINELKSAPPEVIAELGEAFQRLESGLTKGDEAKKS